jgi:hypothetical protein
MLANLACELLYTMMALGAIALNCRSVERGRVGAPCLTATGRSRDPARRTRKTGDSPRGPLRNSHPGWIISLHPARRFRAG